MATPAEYRTDLLVLGSGPAGISAATAYRKAGGDGLVTVVTADVDAPYERPPLSKDVLRGTTPADEIPLLDTPATYVDQGIDIRHGLTVTDLDLQAHSVATAAGPIRFSTCVLATGAYPHRPALAGLTHPDVHTLRSRADAQRLVLAASASARAIVVGSGFIGCEAAAALALRGLDVTLISSGVAPQVTRLGPWAAQTIAGWLSDIGVELIGGRSLVELGDHGGRPTVTTDVGATFTSDMVLLALGVQRDGDLFRRAGLRMANDRIRVDSGMRTSVTGVYAAGDAVSAYNQRAGRQLEVEHWGDAIRMGEIAGANAAGRRHEWSAAPGFWSTIGDRTLKYSAWGDGFDATRVIEHGGGGFTIWYGRRGRTVGVLTHRADLDYEKGTGRVEQGEPLPEGRD